MMNTEKKEQEYDDHHDADSSSQALLGITDKEEKKQATVVDEHTSDATGTDSSGIAAVGREKRQPFNFGATPAAGGNDFSSSSLKPQFNFPTNKTSELYMLL